MTTLNDTMQAYVDNGSVPGAVGLIARGDRVEVQAVGAVDDVPLHDRATRPGHGHRWGEPAVDDAHLVLVVAEAE